MSEVVIVAIGRTPIGRANKGSLIEQRPDDLGAYVVDEVLKQVPQLDRGQIEDVICGCALPGGEQGHNVGRIISILAGVGRPARRSTATAPRRCRPSGWPSTPSRRMRAPRSSAPASSRAPARRSACSRTSSKRTTRALPGNPEGLPAAFMSMGETAENVADKYDITREEMDPYALQSQDCGRSRRARTGSSPGDHPGVPLLSGATMTATTAPGRTPRWRSSARYRRCSARTAG